ncbi:MAG: deoxynucleoside kinase [Bacteroidia bacterium]
MSDTIRFQISNFKFPITLAAMLQARYIVIEGNIGSGKTSLATMLAAHFKSELLLEEFADNPFLAMFYEQPERWAFPVELSFLAARYHQMKKTFTRAATNDRLMVSDYLFNKSLLFAKNNLNHDELLLYENFFGIMNEQMPQPDLIVYIENSVKGLQQNIKKRGRSFENNITDEYLESISNSYRNFLAQHQNINRLILDGSGVDFVNHEHHFNDIVEKIEFALKNSNTLFNFI